MPISELTRRNIIDLLLLQERPFHGKVGLISFLKRIWDLSAIPSTDPRYDTAEGDISKHLVLNNDWDYDYLLQDYLDLPRAHHDVFRTFLEMCVHPGVTRPDDDVLGLVSEVNAFLHLDGVVLQQQGQIAGRPLFKLTELVPGAVMNQATDHRSPRPPFDPQSLAETLIGIFMGRGAARDVAVLTFASEVSFSDYTYDNWDGGTYYWTYSVRVPAALYGQLSPDDIEASERDIATAARELFKGVPGNGLQEVRVSATVKSAPQIREEALHWLNGAGVNNQGRVRSTNIAARQEDGLLFRSQPEIYLYRALKRTGITMAPLPVFLRGGVSYARIEPDFVLFGDKILMIVEVDGDTVHTESPAEADQRVSMFKHEGAFIQHVSASACNTPEKARDCAEQLVQIFNKLKTQR